MASKRRRPPKSVRKALPPPPPPEVFGAQGMIRPNHIRGDANTAAKLISLGVVSEEQARALLEAGYSLAARAASQNQTREYAACMRIIVAVAKLKAALEPKRIQVSGNITMDHALTDLTDEELRILSKLEDRMTIDEPAPAAL